MTVNLKNIILGIMVFFLVRCDSGIKETYWVSGVEKPEILLNGNWELNLDPVNNSTTDTLPGNQWRDIRVPGEVMMQGYAIKHDEPFIYRKKFAIPDDYPGKLIKLRFEGIYSYCRVFVNGNYVEEHSGGFTSWECNITPYVQAGSENWLFIEVTDKADEISYASGYAKHPIGGILRNVWLKALPEIYPEQIHYTTDLDEDYKNAILRVSGNLSKKNENAILVFRLYDNKDNEIKLAGNKITVPNQDTFSVSFPISKPHKWDSEHPFLYKLSVEFYLDDDLTWKKEYDVGFREVEVVGKKILVNGEIVKLRGACRHDIHPTLGRVSTPEYDSLDVQLALDANMNYIRTSHYPPTEYFLEQCDKYGIYIEDETAVCFVGSHRTSEYMPSDSQSDSVFTERYMSQLQEMIDNHRNHPSVIIWSIGNENHFGFNFQKSFNWVKENDPSRPVMFSYPGLVPKDQKAYEILSMHYPTHKGELNQYGIEMKEFETRFDKPVLNDEWAHVACYNKLSLNEDPNIRDFWGISMDSMWHFTYESENSMGGAIWGMIDETFMIPDTVPGFTEWWGIIHEGSNPQPYEGPCIGYGEWGIVDTWRRKKPEFWNTKKAYSPVKLLQTEFSNYSHGNSIQIPVINRFNHTNFNELYFKYTYQRSENTLAPVNLTPHTKGFLNIPITEWKPEESITIKIFDKTHKLLDAYSIRQTISKKAILSTNNLKEKLDVNSSDQRYILVKSKNFKLVIDKTTGLLTSRGDETNSIVESGPYLNIRTKGRMLAHTVHQIDNHCGRWILNEFDYQLDHDVFKWQIKGTCLNNIIVNMDFEISPDGMLKINYTVNNLPEKLIRELGLKFTLSDNFDSLAWERNAYWSYYPTYSISSICGKTALTSKIINTYRIRPEKEWGFDMKSFYYNGIEDEENGKNLTYIAKGSKENIHQYTLTSNRLSKKISVLGNGNISCRIEKDGSSLILYANEISDYIDLSWGNYQRNIVANQKHTGQIHMMLTHSN